MTEEELIAYLKEKVFSNGGYQAKFADDHNLSLAYLNDVLKGRRSPGQKILKALGVEKVVIYKLVNNG